MHIGFILDGNGRWAANKSLPRSIGHKRGAENVEIYLKGVQRARVILCYYVRIFDGKLEQTYF